MSLVVADPSPARAEGGAGTVADARADYEAGATAYDRKDWSTAAIRFARADERVPNPRALQLAMASALHLTDAALAMNLVERAESRAVDGSLAELAKRLRQRFGSEAGRVRVTCPSKLRCRASVDGREFDPSLPRWVAPNVVHRVQVRGEAGAERSTPWMIEKEVRVTAGSTVDVVPSAADLEAAPAAPTAPMTEVMIEPQPEPQPQVDRRETTTKEEHHGISPVVFWSGVVLTGAAAGAGTVLTILSKQRHDDFVASPSPETKSEGETAQTRAVATWIVCGGLLVTTVVIALFTDFRGSSNASKQRASAWRALGGWGSF